MFQHSPGYFPYGIASENINKILQTSSPLLKFHLKTEIRIMYYMQPDHSARIFNDYSPPMAFLCIFALTFENITARRKYSRLKHVDSLIYVAVISILC